MSEQDGISWLTSRKRLGIRPGLERLQRVLSALSDPHEELRFFHIAGTNGKGSVGAVLCSILRKRLSVGVFSSPAFDGFRGQFGVNGERIGQEKFEAYAKLVRDVSNRVTPDDSLTEFEALTVMAICYFRDEAVDAVIWETGLGGKHDSTNVVTPVVAAITNVGHDHLDLIGPTIRDVAREKAGIIKSGIPIVTGAEGEAYRVIEAVAKEQEAPVLVYGRSFHAVHESYDGNSQRMSYRGLMRDYSGIVTPLFGRHQVKNVAVALAMLEYALWIGVVPEYVREDIRAGLSEVTWPLRFEVIEHEDKTYVFDGAHNREGAEALAMALRDFEQHRKLQSNPWTMVVGVLKDKDLDSMLLPVLSHAKHVIVTRVQNEERALLPERLAEAVRKYIPDDAVDISENVEDAVKRAAKVGNYIVSWGSLYTADAARNAIPRWEF